MNKRAGFEGSKMVRNPLLDDEQLFFMHIPKTAGLSLIALLDQHYVKDEICPVHEGYKKFLEYGTEQRNQFKFIRGHFPYKLVNELSQMPRTITFLRNPVERTLSAINQHRRNEQQGISYFKEAIGDIDVDEFLSHPVFGISVPNVAVKYLSDILGRRSQEKKKVNLDLAKERLETFDVIGFLEKFDESLAVLAHTFGFPPIADFPRINVDPSRSRHPDLKQSTLDRIAELNREEIELYEYGLKLFKKRLANMQKEQKNIAQSMVPESSVQFDFRRVDPGQGWYPAERHPKYGIVRWNGPGTISRLRFNLSAKHAYHARIRVVQAVAQDVLNSLTLEVNQQPVPLSMHAGKNGVTTIEGVIPKEIISEYGFTEFTLRVNRTVHLHTIANSRTRIQDIARRIYFRFFRPKIHNIYILEEQEYREGGLLYNKLDINVAQ